MAAASRSRSRRATRWRRSAAALMNAWWSTCAVSTNGCPPNANPKHEICDHLPVRIDPVARHPSDAMASLPARHVQARIVELQGGVADRRMDLAAVDAGSVDAGLRKFISSILVALVDEYVVVDPAGDDVKFGMRDMSCGELGVVLGRRQIGRGSWRGG